MATIIPPTTTSPVPRATGYVPAVSPRLKTLLYFVFGLVALLIGEFASFASFVQEIPDPQDPATFERSKLTRQIQPELAKLYKELLELRRELPHGDTDEIAFDEQERWLRVRRGEVELVCNFSGQTRLVACDGSSVVLCTCGMPAVSGGAVELEGRSGALIR